MNLRSLIALATITTFSTFGCASPADDDDNDEGLESNEAAQSGTTRPNACPQNHVCVYEHRDFNQGKPNAWAWQFGPEEFGRAGGWDRRFTTGKDKASSIINNTGTTMCLVNESAGGYRWTNILKVKGGQRFAYVSDVANDKADLIRKC